jgi:hypothetical protein
MGLSAELRGHPTMRLAPFLRRLFAVGLLMLVTLLPVAATAQAADARAEAATTSPTSIGLTLIEVPIPDGFADASRALPALRQLGERLTPPGNRLLALLIPRADMALARTGQPPSMQRYMMVQTLRQTENQTLTESDFEGVRKLLREQYQGLLKSATPAVQGLLDNSAREIGRDAGVDGLQLKVGDMQGLEVFDERPWSISLLAATRYAVQVGEQTQEVPMAVGITTALVRGKVVYFYAYALFQASDDLDWVRSVTRAWLPLAAKAN